METNWTADDIGKKFDKPKCSRPGCHPADVWTKHRSMATSVINLNADKNRKTSVDNDCEDYGPMEMDVQKRVQK